MTASLICPLCGAPLSEENRALVCAGGHSYDIAASGYCNLLRPGKLRNRVAGDDRDMVSSRGRFLAEGYYRHVLDYIVRTLSGRVRDAGLLIDAGCGEGYYTNGIALAMPEHRAIGLDASKHAVDAASKGARRAGVSGRVRYIAASSADIPVADGAASAVLSLFSPCDYKEFARVTKEGGYLLIGSAGVDHLCEMKAVLYGEDNVRPNVPIDHPVLAEGNGYVTVTRESVTYKTEIIGKEHIDALFSMTPYRWRSPREGAQKLLRLDSINVTVDVDFTLLRLDRRL